MEQVSDLKLALPFESPPLYHIAVALKPDCVARKSDIKEQVLDYLYRKKVAYGNFEIDKFENEELQRNVQSIALCDTDLNLRERQSIDLQDDNLKMYVFHLNEDGPSNEDLGDCENSSCAEMWGLPNAAFHGIWQHLIFDEEIKTRLLSYAMTTLLFSDQKVDCNIISWNRVILLHGPPGTGKTSLCKALAQKICIQMSDRYAYGQLIEINSHGLFSKWFSESGKLVVKMFEKIEEIIMENEVLVFVLIDEVESLTAARKSSLNGNEPSDSIRVVNALLTKIDHIKKYPNVMILTTSNITGAIDLAFVDRADIKQYIGFPSPKAIFQIYHSSIMELMRTGIIYPIEQMLDIRALEMISYNENHATRLSLQLLKISEESYGLSGRTLRKIPFMAHAMFIRVPVVSLEIFLDALTNTVKKQFEDRKILSEDV